MIAQLTKLFGIEENTPLQKVNLPVLNENGITLYIKREDLNHQYLSGNKWHKLKYNLIEAMENKFDTILTFGGAYSNHIFAVAYAGKILKLKTIGIIRGEEHLPLNPTLQFASGCGMKLHYIDRTTYRKKSTNEYLLELQQKFGRFYLIPEGGSNSLAVKGCAEIVNAIDVEYDYLCCASGTGGTFAGLVAGLKGEKKALAFSILKGSDFLRNDITSHLQNISAEKYSHWELILDYHFGGYAKFNNELISFINTFNRLNSIPIEPIYTGKMLYGIIDMVKNNKFNKGDVIIALHTGGLQGLEEMKSRMQNIYESDKSSVNSTEYFNANKV